MTAMFRYTLILWLFCALLPATWGAVSFDLPRHERPTLSLDGTWAFAVAQETTEHRETWARALPASETVAIPHRWQDDPRTRDLTGAAWYARDVAYPDHEGFSQALLVIANPVGMLEVYLDGVLHARLLGNGVTQRLPLPGQAATEHHLAIRLTRAGLPESFSRSTLGLGPITLEALPVARIASASLVLSADAKVVSARYRLTADAPCQVTVSLELSPVGFKDQIRRTKPVTINLDAGVYEGKEVLSTGKELRTWTPSAPHRYRLRVTLSGPAKSGDVYQVYCGRQGIAFDGARFTTQKTPFLLKGLRVPGGIPPLTTPTIGETLALELPLLQRAGFNAIMADGAALPDEALTVADQLGIAVIVDIPVLMDTQGRLAPDIVRVMEECSHHPSIIAWSVSGASDPLTLMRTLRMYDPYRTVLIQSDDGTMVYTPSAPTTRIVIKDEASLTDSAAADQQTPMLMLGTPVPKAFTAGARGVREEERYLSMVRTMVEQARLEPHCLGYFIRPAHDDTCTGLRQPSGAATQALVAARAFNQPRILAIRILGRPEAGKHEVLLINDAGETSVAYQLYRLVTTPDGITQVQRPDTDDLVLISGVHQQDLSRALAPMRFPDAGEYRVQYLLTNGVRVLALSQVFSISIGQHGAAGPR